MVSRDAEGSEVSWIAGDVLIQENYSCWMQNRKFGADAILSSSRIPHRAFACVLQLQAGRIQGNSNDQRRNICRCRWRSQAGIGPCDQADRREAT